MFNKVDLLGFEPRLTDPETAVLPLHHKSERWFAAQKYNKYFLRAS